MILPLYHALFVNKYIWHERITFRRKRVSQDIYLEGDYHYIAMWNYCFGLGFALTSGEEKDAIRATEEYQNMAVYPAKGSVRVINNTIVVKFE